MAFAERLIDVTFTLGTGTFGNTGQNTEKVSGLRVSAQISKAGGAAMSSLNMAIYGLTQDTMNKLSTLGMIVTQVRRNTVLIEAGDTVNGMSTVFFGTIIDGYADLQASPEVAFRVTSTSGLIEAVQPSASSSFTGSVSVATIMKQLAAQVKPTPLTFQNNGVTTVLSHSYFWGSPRDQMKQCVDAAKCEWIIDGGNVIIWPPGGSRTQAQIPLVATSTGMKQSPAYTSKGISVSTLYNPNIIFGGLIQVTNDKNPDGTSILAPADGVWVVYQVDYNLESKMPGGQWFTTIGAARPGTQPSLPTSDG